MTLRINIHSDINRLSRELDDLGRKQLPYATSLALTELARRAQNDVTRWIGVKFDRPTPFTARAPAIIAARKDTMRSVVFLKDVQAAYLALQETGGVREPKKDAVVVPVDIRLNQYGNMPMGVLQRLKSKPNVFVGKVNGVGGFWQRLPHKALSLLAEFRPTATYKPRFGYGDIVRGRVEADWEALMIFALAKAIASARR